METPSQGYEGKELGGLKGRGVRPLAEGHIQMVAVGPELARVLVGVPTSAALKLPSKETTP